ncbi:TDT family transporter [Salinicoccus hispanicus]|uniref:C4-dicarboxylate ABC transporter n=1 Tax=Salinicoccus hispanicus TaxID=157225 RepID=A0A6N8U5T4_9STAP|nr:TDT family transporter [Salinicoccus hispanicus]MXQ51661.1 C4-dicarboxylate ABC transporter [Salinicoccus hispanicus]
MNRFLNQVPLAICGLILGLVSLGNLFFSLQNHTLGWTFTSMGIIIMLPFIIKLIKMGKELLESLSDPVTAAVLAAFPMAMMILCSIMSRFTDYDPLIAAVWWISVILHFALLILFIFYFAVPGKFKSEYLHPGWFIPFVGIAIISITSQNFSIETGKIVFWIALFFVLVLLPIIVNKMIKDHPSRQSFPLAATLTTPGSICLAAYISVMSQPSEGMIYVLLILSQLLYFMTITLIPKMLKSEFHSSYASLAFPVVISATALNSTLNVQALGGMIKSIIEVLSTIELYLAIIIVVYVLIRYLWFLGQSYAERR